MKDLTLRVSLIAGLLSGTIISGTGMAVPAQAAETATEAPGNFSDFSGVASDADLEKPHAGEIVVVATRIKGEVAAPQPPILTLSEEDIAAYGAASIPDLLATLAPQTGSGRSRGGGRPVVLLNGQRISGFREMRNIPPEAIQRLEILPEEVALRFGYPADQRVINFILKDKFAARTVEAEYGQPDRGGSATTKGEASLFRTIGQGRLNLTVTASDTTPLFESERGVVQAPGSVPGSAGARSLIADSRDIGLNATWTTGLGQQGLAGSLTVNGAFTRADSASFAGLDGLTFVPLRRRGQTETSETGITYAQRFGDWQLTATLDGSHAAARTVIDRNDGSGRTDTARSVNDAATGLITLTGQPVMLPAGAIAATFKAGFAWTGIVSSDTSTGGTDRQLRRGDASAGINLGIPIASRRNDVLAGIGDLTVNLSAGADHLSDFGKLTDWSAGLTWGMTEGLGLQASYLVNQAAPGLSDLGSPTVQNLNVPIYDFVRGGTALVTITTGGNRLLARETQRDLKLGLNWQLPMLSNSNLVVEYFRNSSDNVTAAFPVLTSAIESAFPGRVTLDASGRLIAIDRRPITFAKEHSARLRYGVNLGGAIGKPRPGSGSGPFGSGMMGGPPPGAMMGGPPPGRGGDFGGPPGGGRFGNGQGRWNLSIFHTVQFTNRVTVAAGGPVLDLLGGDALSGGGVARHNVEFEGGSFYRGFGMRFSGTWSAPTRVDGSGLPGTSDLRFGALTKINLRLFVNLGQQKRLTQASAVFRGARLSFKVDNLLDSRQRVTDQAGAVPIGYQPDLLDPVGRFVSLELRKQF